MTTEQSDSLHFLDYWQVICSRKEIVIAVSLLMILTGIVITRAMPRVYRATTLIQVQRETPTVEVYQPQVLRYDPYWLRTQFTIIQSEPVIEEVVREMNLNETFGQAYGYLQKMEAGAAFDKTVRMVGSKMKVQQQRDTDLIEISMYFDKPVDEASLLAARTANMVAKVFRNRMARQNSERTASGLEALKLEIDEQTRNLQEAEAELDKIIIEQKITLVGDSGSVTTLAKQLLQTLEMERVRAEIDLDRKRTRFEEISKMPDDELVNALIYVVNDNSASQLMAEKRKAEIELKALVQSDLGQLHPDIVRIRALIAEIEVKISEVLRGVKTGLAAQKRAAELEYERLSQKIEELKDVQRSEGKTSGYREYLKKLQETETLRTRLEFLMERYVTAKIDLRIPRTMVEIIQPAKLNKDAAPVSPNFLMNIMLSVVAGLVSGVALAYFVEYLDTSVKTVEDVERHLKTSVLGIIPQKVKALNDPTARVTHSEAYRVLRTNVKSSKKLKGGKVLAVTSGSVGEGKTTTLFNLAYVSAQLGDRVIIVDSDLHRPRQHKIMGVKNTPGLCNVIVGEVALDDAIISTDQPNLDFLPSGRMASGSVHGLLDTEAMLQIANALRGRYDRVFFDSPPMIGVSDASQLVRIVDGVVMVVQHRKYPRAMAKRAKEMIDNMGGNLLGVVLNNINISRDYSSYYYKYQYYYYPYAGDKGRKSGKA